MRIILNSSLTSIEHLKQKRRFSINISKSSKKNAEVNPDKIFDFRLPLGQISLMRNLGLILVFLLFSCSTAAQTRYSTKSKKAIKEYEAAMNIERTHYNPATGRVDYRAALDMLKKAIEHDEAFTEAHELISEFYMGFKEYDQAIFHLNKSIQLRAGKSPSAYAYFLLAKAYFGKGEYDLALKSMESYLKINSSPDALTTDIQLFIANCEFAKEAKKNPVAFNPINLGPTVNTRFDEYFPTLTVDGKTLLFTRRIDADSRETRAGMQEDFFVTHFKNGAWTEAQSMPSNVNTQNNEGAPTFAPDGRTLVFVACENEFGEYGANRQGYGSCDLFITKKIGAQWRNAVNLPGSVNTANWETQPSLSSDGKTMYFIRGMRGSDGRQNQDIYCTYLKSDGTWTRAERLPNNINTPFREESVFIHPDGKTLYFSSDGHPGFGGLDIFMTQMDDQGNWSTPVNLGYPINSEFDENSLLVAASGELAFFASDRSGGQGGLDLYAFELPEGIRPVKTLYMEGLVYDARTKRPIGGQFELIDLESGKTIISADADKLTGEFLVSLPTKRDYVINVSYPNYTFYSLNFSLKGQDVETSYKLDIPLEPIEADATVRLENVFFDLGKSSLRPESRIELDKLVAQLLANPTVKIEIGGHTDSRGNAQENLSLSQNRAKAVMDYLVSKGIDASRLVAKGYASSKPVYTDLQIAAMTSEKDREKAHQTNRRTEYKILSK